VCGYRSFEHVPMLVPGFHRPPSRTTFAVPQREAGAAALLLLLLEEPPSPMSYVSSICVTTGPMSA
jgi:hypothetical protein